MNRLAYYLMLSATSLFLLIACEEDRVYEYNVDLPDKKWAEDSVLAYPFEVDKAGEYNFFYNVRNTLSYPKYNLYLTYSLEDSTGQTLSSELHEMTLFDPKTGEPRGSGVGDIFTHRIMALENYVLPAPGAYTFRIRQYMRYDTLPEVVSIGLRIEEAGLAD